MPRFSEVAAMIPYDLEVAWQGLRRNVWLSIIAVATFATGIAVSMTAYATLHASLRDPLPEASSRLFAPVPLDEKRCAARRPCLLLSWPDAVALRDARLASRQAVMFPATYIASTEQPGTKIFEADALVTHTDAFPMFGLQFRAGSPWEPTDEAAAAKMAVLTASLARRLFGTEDVIDRTILLDGLAFRVTGVVEDWAPSSAFHSPRNRPSPSGGERQPELFLPIDTALALPGRPKLTTGQWVGCGGELRAIWLAEGCRWVQLWVELEDADAVRRFRALTPGWRLLGLREFVADFVVPRLRTEALAGIAVLLICLAGTAALLLARFRVRGAEIQTRRALGASRATLFRHCWCEATLLCAAGAALGLMLMSGGIALRGSGGAPASLFGDTGIAKVAAVVALAGICCAGTLPAWMAARPAASGDTQGLRLSTFLLAAQVALAVGVLSNTLHAIATPTVVVERWPPTGLDETDRFTLTASWGGAPEELKLIAEADMARLRELPTVLDATFSPHTPPYRSELGGGVAYPETLPDGGMRERWSAVTIYVSDPYSSDVLGARMLAGTWLMPEPKAGEEGVVISSALAKQLFPRGGAIVDAVLWGVAQPWVTGVFDYSLPAIVIPPLHETIVSREGRVHYVVRAEPGQLEAAMRDVVRSLGPGEPLLVYSAPEPHTLLRARSRARNRGVLLALGGASSVLVLVVISSVATLAHHEVLLRRPSLMIRRALGARRGDIVRRFHARSIAVVFAGFALGVPFALICGAWLQTGKLQLLPFMLAGMAATLIVSQLAVLWPALKAAWLPPAAAGR